MGWCLGQQVHWWHWLVWETDQKRITETPPQMTLVWSSLTGTLVTQPQETEVVNAALDKYFLGMIADPRRPAPDRLFPRAVWSDSRPNRRDLQYVVIHLRRYGQVSHHRHPSSTSPHGMAKPANLKNTPLPWPEAWLDWLSVGFRRTVQRRQVWNPPRWSTWNWWNCSKLILLVFLHVARTHAGRILEL